MRFVKKPVEVEAIRFTDNDSAQAILKWAGTPPIQAQIDPESGIANSLTIDTLEGTMFADRGDWIIRGVKGEFYPCKPDIFNITYDPVVEGSQ